MIYLTGRTAAMAVIETSHMKFTRQRQAKQA